MLPPFGFEMTWKSADPIAFFRFAILATIVLLFVLSDERGITAQEQQALAPLAEDSAPRTTESDATNEDPAATDEQSAQVFDPANFQPLIDPGRIPFESELLPLSLAANRLIEVVDFREQTLSEAMRLFSEQSDLNIVPSTAASSMMVSLYLRNVRAMDVLENLTKTHDLYYRIDASSGVIRIYTTKEYEQNLASFREERTEVFTLLYPNPVDVAVAIRDLFGDRVELNFGVGDQDSVLDLIHRLNRFDLIDSRSLGLGAFGGDYAYGGRSFNSLNGLGGFNATDGRSATPSMGGRGELEPLSDLSAEQIQSLIDELNKRAKTVPAPGNAENPIAQLMKERQATIYVTVLRRNNQVVVRTGDEETMTQIRSLIHRLDIPTPLVLLEVKVMSVLLDDQFRSVFDYQFADNSMTGGLTTGDILPSPAEGSLGDAKRLASMVPGGSVLNQGDFTFQYVNNYFRMRMQLLEDDNRVTTLNTPLMLTANNEVSRIFIGDTIPFTVGFNSPQIIAGGGAGNTTIAGTPITELRDVGQSLLITPSINADRTVTLRVVQENARRVINGGRIPVISAAGAITNQEVDTVNRSTISGTVVAKDSMAVVFGGLIENEVSDSRAQVPVLGKLPGIGFFFRRQQTGRLRRELVVMIRPYVFNTPSESAAHSQNLLRQLSVHPSAQGNDAGISTFCPDEAVQVDLDCCDLHEKFRFHNVVPKRY